MNHENSSKKNFQHGFLFKIFPLHHTRLHGNRLKSPRHAPLSASSPASRPVSRPCRKLASQAPRNAKRRQDFSCRQFVVGLPHREAVKPPLLVPVLRDRLLGELCDGQPVRFDPGKDRLDDVRGKAVQGKDAADVASFQTELL